MKATVSQEYRGRKARQRGALRDVACSQQLCDHARVAPLRACCQMGPLEKGKRQARSVQERASPTGWIDVDRDESIWGCAEARALPDSGQTV